MSLNRNKNELKWKDLCQLSKDIFTQKLKLHDFVLPNTHFCPYSENQWGPKQHFSKQVWNDMRKRLYNDYFAMNHPFKIAF